MGVGEVEVEGLVDDLEISADIREAKSMLGGVCRGRWRLLYRDCV